MAKVKAPLFGLGARGQLGKALVYFPWKGIDCVREYVIPTNPRADLQVAQRNKLTAAVDDFHASDFTTLDLSAFIRYASTLAKKMTGFNAFCRAHIKEAILGNAWEKIWNGYPESEAADGFNVFVDKAPGGNDPTVHYGTSKTFMPGSVVMGFYGGNQWIGVIPDLTANQDYYFYFSVGASESDYGRTGIYKTRTLAA